MPEFDRINGVFVATQCTFNERHIFKNAGWQFENKRWRTTDDEKARKLQRHAVGAAKERLENIAALRRAAVESSWAEDSEFDPPAPEGLAYLPFQRAGIEYALARPKTLIADPPGLGKTIQAIGVHNHARCSKVLIVCPASLKVNWAREWRRWDVHGLSVGIAMSIPRSLTVDGWTRNWTEHDWPETDVCIVNYDMLETFDQQIKSTHWDLMICDEAHLLKTPTAIRTVCVFGGKIKARRDSAGKIVEPQKRLQSIQARCSLFLTGTPILSKPAELWTLLRACDPTGLGRKHEDFIWRYCGAFDNGFGVDSSGSSHEEELSRLLRERFMVRRDKRAVLAELPDKRREVIMLPQDRLERPVRKERTRVEKALRDFESMLGIEGTEFRFIQIINGLSERIGAALAAQNSEEPDWNRAVRSLSEPDQLLFSEISAAREEVALAKVPMVVEHLLKLHQAGEPVIVFGYHKSVIREIVERLQAKSLRVGVVTGDVPPMKRQAIVDAFQAGELDIIIGNVIAMGTGFTLTRAYIVVFAELDWVPALMEQAEDRAWRHGQKNAVLAQYLLVDGSIEARMAVALLEKMGVISLILDGMAA